MKDKRNITLCRRKWISLLVIFGMSITQAFSQIPASIEKELDQFNQKVYEALQIINTQPENIAIIKLSNIKPELKNRAEKLIQKQRDFPDLNDEEDNALMMKQMEKPLYKNLMTLLADENFKNKIANSISLQKEFDELMGLMDLDESQEEQEDILIVLNVCTFTVGQEVPNNGLYNVTSNENEAFGTADDTGLLTIEIYGKARGNEINITMIADKAMPGKYKWSTEGQIYIQSQDDNGNEIIQLQNHHEDGFISIDKVDNMSREIEGSFSGLFFDDTEHSEKPVKVDGTFKVKLLEGAY